MQFTENESELLKKWITKKLEDISDADSDVLADYVLALVKTEDSQPVAKANVTENLKDFLADSADSFVEDLFQTITIKSFDPTQPSLKRVAPVYQPPKRHSFEPPNLSNGTRKRSYTYHDWDREEDANGQIQSYQGGERPMKHARRSARSYDQRGGRHSFTPSYKNGIPQMPQLPTPPPGMPPFDPNNPLASMLAFQQAMSMFSGVPNGASPPNGQSFRPPPMRQRCGDYDVKGFCAAGASCPYEHGEDTFVIPGINQEYDPANSALLDITPTRVSLVDTSLTNVWQRGPRGRGRGRGGSNFRGGNKRSDFSIMGPSRDESNTTIVVEQIPVEHCDEQSVRSFFEEFGNIEDVTLYADKKVAVIKYDSHEAARTAYESPKVLFDNRFVKVYWHKPTSTLGVPKRPNDPAEIKDEAEDYDMVDGESIDMEEVTKRQEEAQRKHEDAKKQREETERQKQDLDTKLKAVDEERKKMAELLAKKASRESTALDSSPTHIETEESDQTKALKAQLAKVEAEARSLGLDPDAATNGYTSYPTYRGRGGYRGRGRGRGRGSYRGYRGGWAGPSAYGSAVNRLDNRPKTVAVTFTEGTYDNHDEALRQFLLFNSLDSASLAKHPDREDTALITFNHRYEGEMFMSAAGKSELPHVGKVDLSWHKMETKDATMNGSHDTDVKMAPAETAEQPSSDVQVRDEYDVAEEEDLDRWS